MNIMEQDGSIPSGSIPVQAIYPSGKGFLRKYKTNAVQIISILQIIFAILMITMGILSVILIPFCWRTVCNIGYGIWSGVLFGAAGVLGFCSVKFHPHKYLVLSNMIMCIISASITPLLLIFGVTEIMRFPHVARWSEAPPEAHHLIALPSLLLLFTVLEAIISIVSSAFSCKAVCQCCNEINDVLNYAYYDKRTQQFVMVSGKQGIPIGDGVDIGGTIQESDENQLTSPANQNDFNYFAFK